MKKFLFSVIALMGSALMLSAQVGVADAAHSSNLTLEWYAAPGTGFDADVARTGIGTNGKFYVVKQNDGVYVFNQGGLTATTFPNSTAWVSINCDDAGHVYYRNDVGGWAGQGGAYNSANARFCVIDAATDQEVKSNVAMTGGFGRFDALPHVRGNMMEDAFQIPAPAGWTSSLADFEYSSIDAANTVATVSLAELIAEPYKITGADAIQTLGCAQLYKVNEELHMAVCATNVYTVTYSANGWGNNIADFVYNTETGKWEFAHKFINTVNHSGVGGFVIFNYAGVNYIVYPSGQAAGGYPSGDGFAVMKIEYVDTPANSTPITKEDLESTAAIKYGTNDLSSGNNWRGINVEAVDGESGKFTIYFYSPGKTMQVWTLQLDTPAGVETVNVASEESTTYYNLQGVRVNNPQNGIFIRVCGNKASKIVL